MADESMEFTIKAGQAMAELRLLQQEHSALGRIGNQALKMVAAGHLEAEATAIKHYGQAARLSAQMTQLRGRIAEYTQAIAASDSAGGTARRGIQMNQFAIQQLAYAVDDAAISFGTGGLAGAIRGAANNLSSVAMIVNPLAGAITGVGLAVGSTFIKRFEDAAKAEAKFAESSEKASEAIKKQYGLIRQLKDAMGDLQARQEKATSGENKDRENEDRDRERQDRKSRQPFIDRLVETSRDSASSNNAFLAARKKLFNVREQIEAKKKSGWWMGVFDPLNWSESSAESEMQTAEKKFRIAQAASGDAAQQLQQVEMRQAEVRPLEKAAAARKRMTEFGNDIRKRTIDFGGDFSKAWDKHVEKFDPLTLKIEAARIQAEGANLAFSKERTAAEGPARRWMFPDDVEDGKVSRLEKKVLDTLENTARMLADAVKSLELQKHERDHNKLINRQPGG